MLLQEVGGGGKVPSWFGESKVIGRGDGDGGSREGEEQRLGESLVEAECNAGRS